MAIDIYTTLEELQQGLKLESNRRYRIVLRPKVVAARFSGMLFETNKSFLLPAAIPHIKKNLPRIIQTRSDNKLLIVGHTDTSGETAYNDELSLERASAVQAFLKDDVDGWLCFYETSVPAKKRWGDAEDRLMLGSVPAGRTEEPDPVGDFQLSRGLQVDNVIGPVTRRQLITEYMNQDEVTLPATMEITKHGCGEYFPLDETGTELDADVRDDEHDSLDRRVELFFFHGSIDPPPPGQNSKADSPEYPAWRQAAKLVVDQALGPLPVLRVKFTFDGEVAASEKYELRADGHLLAISTTTEDGMIDQVIPASATSVEVAFVDRNIVQELHLADANEFPSVDEVEGVQLRLAGLGFFPGRINGEMTAPTSCALAAFKRSQGLPDDSNLDASTRAALKEAYGS